MVLTPWVLGATALTALLLVVVAYEAVGTLDTIAHEAGHMVVGALTGHRIRYFEVTSGGEGATWRSDHGWSLGRILLRMAGYTTPPLLGLGGAALLAAGKAWPLLWTVVVLLVLALIKAEKEWTTFVVLLWAAATGYVALYGAPPLQAAYAAGLVWLLLFGGLRAAVESSTDDDSDAAKLARDTLIPRIVWKTGFVVLALFCLWKGFVLLAS
ncbi:MAG TPA: M50 family metallopeptidase [Pseudonocardia sp.]|nr:M50 family metallopeptidase [Pseudonocardia sp.]